MDAPDGEQTCTLEHHNTERPGPWAQEGTGGRVARKGPRCLLQLRKPCLAARKMN